MFQNNKGLTAAGWTMILLVFALVISSTLFLAAKYTTTVTQIQPISKNIRLGVHDPGGDFDNNESIKLENYVVRWDRLSEFDIAGQLQKIADKGRQPILTIDPYPYTPSIYIFNKILEGQYDTEIDIICSSIKNFGQEVMVRWARNMDFANTDVYAWANNDSLGYKKAYYYFVDNCKARAPSTKYIWSPSGMGLFEQFYPGDDYVDVIAFSLYSNQNQNANQIVSGDTGWNFEDRFNYYYDTFKNRKKEIMVAEFGASGQKDAKSEWVSKALRRILDTDVQRRLSYVIYDQTPINPPITYSYLVPVDGYRIDPIIFKK